MYAGRIVEEADVRTIFKRPLHPYTQGLLESIPRIDVADAPERLEEIPGRVPDLLDLPPGCAFHDRCAIGDEECRRRSPRLLPVGEGHTVRCWRVTESVGGSLDSHQER
jgi:oligopeptide/dipeptide ABC transporter ATP-binding protein